MRIAISGSRTFTDRQLVGGVVDELLAKGHFINVGDDPSGVDLFVREYAGSTVFELELDPDSIYRVFKADWAAQGKAAGSIRNAEMLAESDGLVAMFAPGKWTPGTRNAVLIAQRMGLPRRVFSDGRWLRYAAQSERVSPLRVEAGRPEGPGPDYWACTACGSESPNPPQPDAVLIDRRFGKKRCADCKKVTVWRIVG